MHIIYLCQQFDTDKSMLTKGAFHYAQAWVESGHSVTIITNDQNGYPRIPKKKGKLIARESYFGMKIIRVASLKILDILPFRKQIQKMVSAVFYYWAGRRIANSDVIISTMSPRLNAMVGLLLARSKRKPFICEVEEL